MANRVVQAAEKTFFFVDDDGSRAYSRTVHGRAEIIDDGKGNVKVTEPEFVTPAPPDDKFREVTEDEFVAAVEAMILSEFA